MKIRPRIVLDTNVLVSATVWKGKPYHLLNGIKKGKLELIISSEIIEELLGVLEREKKLKLDQIKINKIKTMLLGISNLVRPIEKFEVTVDPKDNKIIECAVAGNTDYLVSGDKGILILKEFRGIKIVSVAEMFEIIFPAYPFLL